MTREVDNAEEILLGEESPGFGTVDASVSAADLTDSMRRPEEAEALLLGYGAETQRVAEVYPHTSRREGSDQLEVASTGTENVWVRALDIRPGFQCMT